MAQIESRPAFRLPWTADRTDSDQPIDGASTGASVDDSPSEAPNETPSDGPISEEGEAPSMIETTAGPATRRPTKFMADLSRAMQTAAEVSRDETMARLSADVKTVVEEIHAASTVEAAALRRRADDDVAAVREWSKAEIARIRDEAEARVATRKVALDGEMDAHGKVVEARVEQVTATVSEFEARMTTFFEHLMAEQDPTRIATMAETMPDPPDLASVAASISEPPTASFDPNAQVLPDAPVAEITETPAAEPEASADQADTAEPTATGTDFAAAEAEAASFTGDLGEDDELRQPAATTESDAPESAETAGDAPAEEAAASEASTSETAGGGARERALLDPRRRPRARQRREHRDVQAQPRAHQRRQRHHRCLRARRRVRLHGQPRCGPEPRRRDHRIARFRGPDHRRDGRRPRGRRTRPRRSQLTTQSRGVTRVPSRSRRRTPSDRVRGRLR